MVIRLSQILTKKLKLSSIERFPIAENPLLDWSMQMFMFDRRQYVLISNSQTLYSAIFLAGGTSAPHAMTIKALQAITEQSEVHHLLEAYQSRVPSKSAAVQYAKSLNRQVTGSMNELILQATHALAEGINLIVAADHLNRTLLSALNGTDGRRYGRPLDAMKRLLE